MNNTVFKIVPFTNVSKKEVYNADITERASLQLFSPIIDTIQNYLYKSYPREPDYIISELREHHDIMSIDGIRKGAYVNLLPMLFGYALIIAGLIALFVGPVVCYMGTCSKKTISISKYQVCFCIESFIFIIACVLLAFSTAGSIQSAVDVDEALDVYPALGLAIVDDIINTFNLLKEQLDVLRHDLQVVLEYKRNCITDLPGKLVTLIEVLLFPLVPEGQLRFKKFYDKYNSTIEHSGLIYKDGQVYHNLEFAMKEMEVNLEDVRMYLHKLKDKIINDEALSIHEKENLSSRISGILRNASVNFSNIRVLNWEDDLASFIKHISEVILPRINDSVFFIKFMSNKVENELLPIVNNITAQKYLIENWANTSLNKLDNITEKFLSLKSLIQFKTSAEQFLYRSKSLNIPSSEQKSQFSGRAILLLIPGFHGLIFLFIVIIASVIGAHEIRRLNAGSQGEPHYRISYGAKLLWASVIFGLIMLWMHLILAGIFYIGSIIITILCIPVMDATIFTRYTDDTQVWGNKTWIDAVMLDFSSHYSEKMELMKVLQKCKNNETIYNVLKMEKFWNINDYMKLEKTDLKKDVIMSAVDTAIANVELPNVQLMEWLHLLLNNVIVNLNLNFTQEILKEVIKFYYTNLTNSAIDMLLKEITKETKYGYIRDDFTIISNELKKIEQRSMSYIIQNNTILLNLKENLRLCKNELPHIIPSMSLIKNIMKQSSKAVTHEFTSTTLETANNFANHFKQHAEKSFKHDIGNCHILYALFAKFSGAVCNNGHDLFIGVWFSLGLMGTSMIITILLSCRIASYLRGAHKSHYHWQQRLVANKWNETPVVRSDALLFDSKGEFLGNAVMMPGIPGSSSPDEQHYPASSLAVHSIYKKN